MPTEAPVTATHWSPIPDRVTIRCPRCAAAAEFHTARFVVATTHAQRDELARDERVELRWITDRAGQRHAIAIHHPPLAPGPAPFEGHSLRHCPVGLDRNAGSFVCSACHARGRHALRWPADAWFAWDVRGQPLWAYTRAHAQALRDFIASAERDASAFGEFEWFLRHVPGVLLVAKRRDAIVSAIERRLAE